MTLRVVEYVKINLRTRSEDNKFSYMVKKGMSGKRGSMR